MTTTTKKLVSVLALLGLSAVVAVVTPTTTAVMAQTTPSVLELFSPHIVAGGEFVTPIVEQARQGCNESSRLSCVDIVYASASIVVLTGDVVPEVQVNRYGNNHFIWQAVEQIKAQGYIIQSISVGGAGTEANPNVFQIVMTK